METDEVLPAMLPGLMTQFPAGNPERVTDPVGIPQVGCETEAMTGAEGAAGCVLIVAVADGEEVHPPASVTV